MLQPGVLRGAFPCGFRLLRTDARSPGQDDPVHHFRMCGGNPGGNTGTEAVRDNMAWIKPGFPEETEQAFAVFWNSPWFRRPAALPVPGKIDDHETMVSGDPVGNRLHQLDAAAPSMQEQDTASAVPGSFVVDFDAVNFFYHKFLLSGCDLPDIPAFHAAEIIFLLQIPGNG